MDSSDRPLSGVARRSSTPLAQGGRRPEGFAAGLEAASSSAPLAATASTSTARPAAKACKGRLPRTSARMLRRTALPVDQSTAAPNRHSAIVGERCRCRDRAGERLLWWHRSRSLDFASAQAWAFTISMQQFHIAGHLPRPPCYYRSSFPEAKARKLCCHVTPRHAFTRLSNPP